MLTGSLTLIIKQQPRCVQHFSVQAIPQDPALRSFQSYAVITARRTVKEGQGMCACAHINAKDFLQQEKMRENVPATGTSSLRMFFSVTQCHLFISVARMSLWDPVDPKEANTTARNQADIPAMGQGQMPGHL